MRMKFLDLLDDSLYFYRLIGLRISQRLGRGLGGPFFNCNMRGLGNGAARGIFLFWGILIHSGNPFTRENRPSLCGWLLRPYSNRS